MTVTVVSCAYGPTYCRFLPRWAEAVAALDPKPDRVIVAADRTHTHFPGINIAVLPTCPWTHPQAFYLNQAISLADTDWVWIVDIDDFPMRDGLAGLDEVAADVWQMGFLRSDGELYAPEPVSSVDYLESDKNTLVGTSAFRLAAYQGAGGFRDVALQDWALWRAMFRAGASFEFSGRAHFHYMRHPSTRGETELGLDRRPAHLAEMMGAELAHA